MPAATSKVVFLIDEQSLMTSLLSLQQLKLSIMRILIYFHLQKRQVQWGFRFFSTQTRYPSESMRRFYTFTLDSFEALEKEYSKRDTHRPKQVILGTPIMRIKQVLKEVIGDFQWENNDLGVPEAAQNHIFILSACPSSLIEMKQFFVSPHPDDSLLHVALLPQYFEQTKLYLSSTLLESYASRNIVLNIIDTHQQSTRPHDQWIARVTREGFGDCLDQFKGRYIPLELLMRNACLFGRSFLSDIHSALTGSPSTLSPVWRGALKTLDVALDGMVLYGSLHDSAVSDSSLMFVSEIRVLQLLHLSQFSPGWLLKSDDGSLGSCILTHDVPGTASDYRKCLSELFHTQSIMIAELVPIEGFEDLVQGQKVCIEAYSPEAAFVRSIQIKDIISGDISLSITNYPLGPHCMAAELLPLTLPDETLTEEVSYKIKPLPEAIKQMIVLPDPSTITPKKEKSSSSVQKERKSQTKSAKKRTPLPTDVNMLEKALEELYFESVYTQKHTIDTIIHTIKRWLNNLSRNHTIQEIIDTLFKYTSTLESLETKYKSGVPKPTETQSHMLEHTFQQEWWRQVKSKFQSDARSEKLISLSAKTREAQLQVVLYCFICRLMIKLPSSIVQRDPVSSAEDFFQKVVVTLTMHDLGRFLGELDSEEGPQAVKRRDPCDLSDHAFMTVLQRRFEQLPDLLQKFKELSGTDEMTSSGSSDLEDDVASLDVVNFEYPVDPIKSSPKSKVYRQQKRPMPDVLPGPHSSPTIKKMQSKTLFPTTSQLSSSKTLAPVKIKKTNSNTLDMFLKRTVDVKASVPTTVEALRGEAAQAAIAKVNRSALNGRPTMKRSGSFTSSAQAAKKQKKKKTEPSMLSSQQETTGTVILRRSNNIPNAEETTPRTSMNRYLGTNLFADFSETCLSPSNRPDRTEPSIQIPKTPESTPLRFRKIMMDRVPHRRENSDNSLSADFPDIPEDPTKTPYTPRTAARRERDRMDRSQPIPNLGRNLTMRLQDIFEQEKAKEDDFSVKSRQSSGIFFEDALNDSPMSSQADNNPFFTASSQASTATVSPHRPSIKRGATIDDLFDDDNDDVLGGSLMPLNFGQPYMIGEEDESDSDDEHAMPLI